MGMRDIIERLVIKGDSTSAQKAAKTAEKSLTGSFFKASIAADAARKAFELVTQALEQGVEAALENERTTLQLQAALRLQGREVEQNTEFLAAQAASIESVSNISDEVIRKYQAQAINLGIATEETDKFVRAAIVLAKATGKDVNTAFEQVIKSTSGTKEEMLKLIPEVNALSEAELKAGKAADELVKKYGDFIKLGSEGNVGRIESMKSAFGNLAEEIAKAAMNTSILQTLIEANTRGAQDLADAIAAGGLEAVTLGFEERAQLAATFRKAQQTIGERGAVAAKADGPMEIEGLTVTAGPQSAELQAIQLEIDSAAQIRAERQVLLDRLTAKRLLEEQKAYHAEREELEAEAEERRLLAQEEAAQRELELTQLKEQQKLGVVNTFTNAASSAILGALDAALAGEKVIGAQIALEFTRNIGRQLVAAGLKDVALGISRGFSSYGWDATAYALLTHGTKEIAVGGAMAGGAVILNNAFGGGGGGGGGGRTSTSGEGFGGSRPATAFGRERSEERFREPENITIVFNGPTTAAAVGVEINRALGVAREQGLIGGA